MHRHIPFLKPQNRYVDYLQNCDPKSSHDVLYNHACHLTDHELTHLTSLLRCIHLFVFLIILRVPKGRLFNIGIFTCMMISMYHGDPAYEPRVAHKFLTLALGIMLVGRVWKCFMAWIRRVQMKERLAVAAELGLRNAVMPRRGEMAVPETPKNPALARTHEFHDMLELEERGLDGPPYKKYL